MIPESKRCPSCGETKPASAFGLRSNGRWLRGECKDCGRAFSRRFHHSMDPAARKAAQRVSDLRIKFGITTREYDAMLAAQGGVCGICQRPERATRFGVVRRLCVDHDHETGRIRGLLCAACNAGIGHFGDDPLLLERAAGYLDYHLGHDVDGGHAA